MAASPHLYHKGKLYYARFRIPKPLESWLDQRELRWSLQTDSLITARKHLLIATVMAQEFFGIVQMAVSPSHAPLTESEKIAIKAELARIKYTKMAEFKALINKGDHGIIEAQRLLEQERPLMNIYMAALANQSFDCCFAFKTDPGFASKIDPPFGCLV